MFSKDTRPLTPCGDVDVLFDKSSLWPTTRFSGFSTIEYLPANSAVLPWLLARVWLPLLVLPPLTLLRLLSLLEGEISADDLVCLSIELFNVSLPCNEQEELDNDESLDVNLDAILPTGDFELVTSEGLRVVEILGKCGNPLPMAEPPLPPAPLCEYNEYGEFNARTGEGPSSKTAFDPCVGVL